MNLRSLPGILLALAIVATFGCGVDSKKTFSIIGRDGGATSAVQNNVTPTGASTTPPFNRVFIVMEENHSYSSVIGNSSMPYLNSLASHYGLATQYYANTHPSIGNYFMLTTGKIITNNDSFSGTVSGDNVVAHLLTAGKPGNVMRKVCLTPGTPAGTPAHTSNGTILSLTFLMSSTVAFKN